MSRWRALAFDLDDTLYPERDYVLSGFRAVAAWAQGPLGVPAADVYAELQALFRQWVRGDTFDRWASTHGLDPAAVVPQMVAAYRAHTPTLSPFPEVSGLLAEWHRRYRIGLVSDGYLQVQQAKLAALGLSAHFDALVFSDEWGRAAWKPSPLPFEMLLQRLGGLAAREVVYVGDNPLKDFAGARQVGLATVWLRRSDGEYSHHAPPTAADRPDIEIASLSELQNALIALENQP